MLGVNYKKIWDMPNSGIILDMSKWYISAGNFNHGVCAMPIQLIRMMMEINQHAVWR